MPDRARPFLFFLLAALALAGCGKGVGDYQVPQDFKPYVANFADDAGAHGRSVEIHSLVVTFGDTGDAAGKCLRVFLDTPQVLIRQDIWDQLSEASRTILVYHELGHCILNRAHTSETNHDDQWGDYPKSLMNPVMLDEKLFEAKRDYYLNELFQ